MATFPFELVTPESLLFTGEVDSVVIPGVEGELTVLKDHAPLMTTLKPGVVSIAAANKQTRLYVRGGFADISPVGLTILAEAATPYEQLDAARIEIEIQDAEEAVSAAQTEDGRRLAREKVDQLRSLEVARP